MTEKLRGNKEKTQYKILLMDFMVWMQVQGERNKDILDMSEAEIVDEYLNSNWYEIHNEVYINEKSK
jgi:hypothetical protein